MKKYIIFLTLAVISTALFAQSETASTKFAVASWDKTTQNVGKILYEQPVTIVFTVTNIGTIPLQIMGVERSCNCTVPEWPAKAIQPGSTGVVKVVYDAKVGGFFTKTIKVTANTEEPVTELTITGEVTQKASNQ